MRPRTGISLVEVLVAALLLAIGISAALGAFTAAARFRERAALREFVARTVADRLERFTLEACTGADTVRAEHVAGVVEQHWLVSRAGAVARLDGYAAAHVQGGARLALVHQRRCR